MPVFESNKPAPCTPLSLPSFSGYFEQCFAGKGFSWHQKLARLFSFCSGKSSSLLVYLWQSSPYFCKPKPPLPEPFTHRWSCFSWHLPLIFLAVCPLHQTKQNLLWDILNISELWGTGRWEVTYLCKFPCSALLYLCYTLVYCMDFLINFWKVVYLIFSSYTVITIASTLLIMV